MKVFILIADYCEEQKIKGVYSTRQKAEWATINFKEHALVDSEWLIEEFEIDIDCTDNDLSWQRYYEVFNIK